MDLSIVGQSRLCSRCSNLDIASVRSSTHPRLRLGPVTSWSPDTCDCCNFLVSVLSRDPTIDLKGDSEYFLFSIKTRHAPDKLFQILDHRLIVLSTKESGPPPGSVPYIAAHTDEPPQWLQHIRPLIDFERAKEWLRVCLQLHGDNCSGNNCGGSSTYKSQNFRLIDCSTGKVMRADGNEPYAALSYVWGEQDASTRGSHAYPQTIQDAIVTTRQLGLRWLWVDNYCIDQRDPNDLRAQLQQMDIIYRQAAVTIIAAAGSSTHYGLPGVNKSYRQPTASITVGNEHLCAIPKPELRPEKCRWISRAWTYQEGLLSTRRLIFTDEQLYFECQGCYCAEMLDIPLASFKKMHTPEKPWLHKRYRAAGRMGLFPLNGCGIDPWDIYARISEYSARTLSHDSDILNGILGIFRAYEKMQNPMRHLHGLPFAETLESPNATSTMIDSKRVLPTFAESLRWDLAAPSRRRPGFPSWSWTGWYGRISWPPEYTDVDVVRTPRRIERPRDPAVNANALKLSFDSPTLGHKLDWTQMQHVYATLISHQDLGIVLTLEAEMVPAFYRYSSAHDGSGSGSSSSSQSHFLISDTGSEATTFAVQASLTTAEELRPDDEFLGVLFHRTVGRPPRGASGLGVATQHVLVVRRVGVHWERVALGSFVVGGGGERRVGSSWRVIELG